MHWVWPQFKNKTPKFMSDVFLVLQYIATVLGLLLAFLFGFILEVFLIIEGCKGWSSSVLEPGTDIQFLSVQSIAAKSQCVLAIGAGRRR